MNWAVAAALIASVSGAADRKIPPAAELKGWTATFEPAAELAATGRNPWFILEPGYVLVLAGTEDGASVESVLTVLDETATIDGASARAVEDRESKGGKLAEVTKDWFAISQRTNAVYYLGEDVDNYENGKVSGHGGSWRSGVNGCVFGLIMPGLPLLAARYLEEQAPGVDYDRGVVVGLDETVVTPAGRFEHCLRIEESNALDLKEGKSYKLYAPGVGIVQDGGMKLVRYGPAKGGGASP